MKKNEVNNCCTLCSECLLLLLQSAAVETTQADTFCSLSTQPLKRKKEQKNVYFAWFKKKKKDLSPRPCRPNIKPPGFRALYINMTSTTSRSCSKLCISIEALFRSKDSISHYFFGALAQLWRQDHTVKGPLCASHAPWQHHALCTHFSVDSVLKNAPCLPLLLETLSRWIMTDIRVPNVPCRTP